MLVAPILAKSGAMQEQTSTFFSESLEWELKFDRQVRNWVVHVGGRENNLVGVLCECNGTRTMCVKGADLS